MSDPKKTQYHLIPGDALEQVAQAMMVGAETWGEGDWEREDFEQDRLYDAALRHLLADRFEEDLDESGLLHLAHAAANAIMLLAHRLRLTGVDARPESVVRCLRMLKEPSRPDLSEPISTRGIIKDLAPGIDAGAK